MIEERNYSCFDASGNTQGADTGKDAVKELKKASKSFVEEANKATRNSTSSKIIDLAKKNYQTSKDLMNERIGELSEKKLNPFAKIMVYLAKQHKIFLGSLSPIGKMCQTYDKIIGKFIKSDVVPELIENSLYVESKSKGNTKKIINDLKKSDDEIIDRGTNATLMILVPRSDSDQYFSSICATKDSDGKIELKELQIKYTGRNDEGKPKFDVFDSDLELLESVDGIEELKNFVAFSNKNLTDEDRDKTGEYVLNTMQVLFAKMDARKIRESRNAQH